MFIIWVKAERKWLLMANSILKALCFSIYFETTLEWTKQKVQNLKQIICSVSPVEIRQMKTISMLSFNLDWFHYIILLEFSLTRFADASIKREYGSWDLCNKLTPLHNRAINGTPIDGTLNQAVFILQIVPLNALPFAPFSG